MQSGTQKEVVMFSEPEATTSGVELHVHCDEPVGPDHAAESPQLTEKTAVDDFGQSSGAESTAESAAESKQQRYKAFSESFGTTNQDSHGFTFQSWQGTWDQQIKQPFNIAYFMVATAAIAAVSVLWNLPVLWLFVGVFGVFALAAFRAAWTKRVHPNDFAVTLPDWTRHSLRTTALILPIPFFAILLAQPLAYAELREGQQLFTDGKFKDALVHLNLAATLNPRLEEAFMELADCYNFTYDHDKSLINAEKALALDPTDGAAWASKAWALNKQDKFAQGMQAAQNAVNLDRYNGQANHALAEAYYNLGQYSLALEPAAIHVQVHNNESSALELRAKIFDKLDLSEDAAKDRAAAAALDN